MSSGAAGASPPRVSVVMPVLNAMRYLPRTVPALHAAVDRHGAAEVVFVDNGSTDGSAEWLQANSTARTRIVSAPYVTISALRNIGARTGSGAVLSFVDSDCLVSPDYLQSAETALRDPAIHACGSPYLLPDNPHWVERVWHDAHVVPNDITVTYLPAGNFVVHRRAFEAVGGFREGLVTGEDADLGLRLTENGFVIRSTSSVNVQHLGNPTSLTGFYRKQRWHALGMFGTVRLTRLDKPVAMTLAHLVALGMTLLLLLFAPLVGVLCLFTAAWFVPAAAVAFRWRRGGRIGSSVFAALLLYQVYFLARIAALAKIVARRRGQRG